MSSAATTYDLGRARPIGWWGMVLFVAGETTLFLMLFASYFYLRLQSHHWPPPGVAEPAVLVPVLLAAALAATSFAMQRAWRAGRDLARAAAWRWLAIAGTVQVAYLGWQIHDFVDLCRSEPPSHSAYASVHLTLLALDHAHVLLGALLTAWLLLRLATRITPYRVRTLQAVTFYWHAVNAITVAVLLVTLSPHIA